MHSSSGGRASRGLALALAILAGCSGAGEEYVAVASISRNGFALDADAARRMDGSVVRLSGYVDHGNLQIEGPPQSAVWVFHLKAKPDDAVGQSFAVRVPADQRAIELQAKFEEDARLGRPTLVLVTGRLETFDAPTNLGRLTGLRLQVHSAGDVRLTP